MNFHYLNLDTWERKQHYDYYIHTVKAKYNVNVNLDITELLATVKQSKLRFYPTFIYVISKAINQNKEFRMAVDHKGRLGYWDYSNPSYTIFHDDDKTFSDIWTEYNDDFSVFYQQAVADLEKYKDVKGIKAKPDKPKNFCPMSAVPWLSFTGYSNDTYSESKLLFPVITFGKYFMRHHRMVIPFSIFVNHAVADGYHTCKLLQDIQQFSDERQIWLNI
jgi:chloramphenicol O-acetyltransferase type A